MDEQQEGPADGQQEQSDNEQQEQPDDERQEQSADEQTDHEGTSSGADAPPERFATPPAAPEGKAFGEQDEQTDDQGDQGDQETTSSVSTDGEPASQGSTDPSSLETAHSAVSDPLGHPEGEASGAQDEPEEAHPVTVIFNTIPEAATISVHPAAQKPSPVGEGAEPSEADEVFSEDNSIQELPIPAQEDGSFALLPGDYTYTAAAEGYISIENIPFTVEASEEPVTISVTLEPIEAEPEPEPEPESAPFDQSATMDGVVITVRAEAGAFPNDAELSVKHVYAGRVKQAGEAIDEVRDEGQNVAASYTFDIKVIDPVTKEELQPAAGYAVEVSFALAEANDENLEANVYHVTQEETTGALTAEKLDTDVDAEGETVTATTEGFSLYTVEFTYNDLEYVLQGDESVALGEILAELKLTGEVSAVEVSDDSLFNATLTDGGYVVTARRAFSTTEWMKITIDGIEYKITVTDGQGIDYLLPDGSTDSAICTVIDSNNKPTDWTTGWYAVTSDAPVTIEDRVTVSGTVNLILCNGATLTAGKGITVAPRNTLNIYWRYAGAPLIPGRAGGNRLPAGRGKRGRDHMQGGRESGQ